MSEQRPKVTFTTAGTLVVNGVNVPTTQLRYTKNGGEIGVIKATIPVIDASPDTPVEGEDDVRLLYVVAIDGHRVRTIEGKGDTPLEAMRDLVRQLEETAAVEGDEVPYQ